MTTLTVVRSKYNPDQTYEEFKEARLQGFGGSDIGSLLNEGDYSCKRRLFLERLGLMPEDKEDRLKHHAERGKFFEAPVAELFASRFAPKEAGHKVVPCGTGYLKEYPFIRSNADRLIYLPGGKADCVGVLEIKCPSLFSFKKIKKEGLPKEYILQLQWQMLCYGTSWGVFAIFCADSFELEWFEVQRDNELIEGLFRSAQREWAKLNDYKEALKQGLASFESLFGMPGFPESLDSYSKACAKCPGFSMCHGNVEFKDGMVIDNPGLEAPGRRLLEVKAQAKALEKEEEELKELIKAEFRLMPCDYMTANGLKLKVSERSRENVLSTVKKVLTEEQKASYIRNTTYQTVDVKESQ